MNAMAKALPNFIGGSADLGPSNKTHLDGCSDVEPGEGLGRNIHFGVREHAMGAIVNGMGAYGGLIPYAATFLVFSDYMRPSMRIAALSHTKSMFIFTHDSVGVGEDGPTHQPIEHLASLRAIPELTVIRPADACETVDAWRAALGGKGPVAFALSRQNLPTIDRGSLRTVGDALRGAYVISDCDSTPHIILIATGSEVHTALEAKGILSGKGFGVRVVSMPSWEFFEAQPENYQNSILPPQVKPRVAVEAGCSQGWHRWVGDAGRVVGIDRFGASAPGDVVMRKFGITAENVANAAMGLVGK
jgi:transketolase